MIFAIIMLPILKSIWLLGSFIISLQSTHGHFAPMIVGARTIIVGCILNTILTVGWLLSLFMVQLHSLYNRPPLINTINTSSIILFSFITLFSIITKSNLILLSSISLIVCVFKLGFFKRPPATREEKIEVTLLHGHLSFFITTMLYLVFTLLLVVLLGTFFEESKGITTNRCDQPIYNSNSYKHIERKDEDYRDYGYPLCNQRWHDLDIVDFSLMSYLAYWKGEGGMTCMDVRFNQEFSELFDINDWSKREDISATSVAFYDLYSKSRNLSVISIRGTTSRFLDILQDVDLYADIGLFQVISTFMPVMNILPDTLIVDLVRIASIPEFWTSNNHHYYHPVLQYVSKIKNRNVIIVGHSLGGAIAQIVGARLEQTAFAFSAPGIFYTRRKVGVSLQNIEKYTINIVPFKDPVTKIDKHGGLVQQIMCREKNPAECHSITLTMCELWRSCRPSTVAPPLVCQGLNKQQSV